MAHKKPGVILLTIDPLSPNLTVIGYESNYNEGTVPVGCGGGDVLAAILDAGFEIEEVVSGDSYVLYTLLKKKFKLKDQHRLEEAFNNLNCEPVS